MRVYVFILQHEPHRQDHEGRDRLRHFKTALALAMEYAVVAVEDLNLKAMQRLWGRKISDLGHAAFLNILRWECSKNGSQLLKIDRFYPSSKTCSECGHVLAELPLSVRSWQCPTCASIHDRDLNAVKNIERVGARPGNGANFPLLREKT